MRVLLVNKFLERRGGVETYVIELGRVLAEAGHEVQYFGMDGPERVVGNEWGIYVPRIELGGRQGLAPHAAGEIRPYRVKSPICAHGGDRYP